MAESGRPRAAARTPGGVGRSRGMAAGFWAAAAAGALGAGVAIAVSELGAGLVPGAPSLVTSIGSLVISLQPPGARERRDHARVECSRLPPYPPRVTNR